MCATLYSEDLGAHINAPLSVTINKNDSELDVADHHPHTYNSDHQCLIYRTQGGFERYFIGKKCVLQAAKYSTFILKINSHL